MLWNEEEKCNVVYPYVVWVIDLEASYHATNNKEVFTSYKVGDFGKLKIDNQSNADITGVGDMRV